MFKSIINWFKGIQKRTEYKDFYPFLYSEMIKRFPIHGKIGDDDIIMISHKINDGYETCYVHMSDIIDYINSKKKV